MDDLGNRLQKLRIERGLSQKDLALRINKSPSAISSYETGAQMPPLDVLISIALTLNTTLDYLAGISSQETILLDGLTDLQKSLLNSLLLEFHSENNNPRKDLSPSQIAILHQLFQVFFAN